MLRIHLLGHVRVLNDDTPLKMAVPPKVVPLWAYLLFNRNAPIPRDTLAGLLWTDESEADARANVRRHLYHLQRFLPPAAADRPWLLNVGDAVQWNLAADYWLDVGEFERLSRIDDQASAAVELYTGDLLVELYDDWLFYERERLRGVYLATLGHLLLRRRAERAYPAAIGYAQRFLRSDPLREDVARQLIALRYESGD